MLPESFLDWWFAPWAYTVSPPCGVPAAADLLGQRDGYRLWCDKAGVASTFPAHFDPEWHVAATGKPEELMAAARLFAGLFAARTHDQDTLAGLPFADRKWCMSIATTQPLAGCRQVVFDAGDASEVRGLIELARRLEPEFPGLWPRLRLQLPATLSARVDVLLQEALALNENRGTSALRAQRCWLLCRGRVNSTPSSLLPARTDAGGFDGQIAA